MTNRVYAILALVALIACASCDGIPPRAEAATPTPVPVSVMQVDGVYAGTTRLTTVSVAGRPSFTTQAQVASVGDMFMLVPGNGIPLQSMVHVQAADGRHWHRMGIPNPEFLAAKFWSVGPGGSDEAIGWGPDHAFSDAVRLATMGELNRRLVGFDGVYPGWYPDPALPLFSGPSIHLTGNIDVPSFAVLSNLRMINSQGYPRIFGDLIPVDGSATNRVITAAQPAVPTTNTERTVTIAGLGTVPLYTKKAIVSADGLKFAWVTRQLVPDVLAISQPRIPSFPPTGFGDQWLLGYTGTATGADFVVGDHVGIYDMVTIPDWPFSAEGVAHPLIVRVHFGNHDASYFAHGDLGHSGPYITQCIFGDPTFQTSYEFSGGIADTGGNGFITQPLFIGTHNTIRDATWLIRAGTSVETNVSPFWWNTDIQFADELNIVGHFKVSPRMEFPSQNNGSIAMFGETYPWGAFQFTPTDHHGGGRAELYIGEGVVWYGHVAGAALSLPQGASVRLPVNTIYLDSPGSTAIGGVPAGSGQIFVGAGSGLGNDPQMTFKNFSNVPFFDLPTGTSVAGHQ